MIHGALGARGPVLDHFNAEAVRRYLNRMSDAMRPVVGNLHDRIRSFFTDSFELEGSNWCKDIREEFQKRRGYDLYTYYPLILKKVGPYGNEIKTPYGARIEPDVMERIYRMRYDYELTLAELFKERFLDELNAWCRACGVKSRIQAYGKGCMPVESLMDVDIPECETWYHKENGEIFPDDKMSGHGYKMVNKFVASGAHLSGKNVVSCEEITNTRFVFNETLERIKITGDLSNLSGVTHSVLHGYNYSPAEAPFPGWVRYGTFYNERNRCGASSPNGSPTRPALSTVLRNSEMQTDIALMQPLVDMWTYLAPQFEPSPGKWRPFYVNTLWEAVHQNGGGCDYLTESILQRSTFADGRIEYGDRSYKALLLLEVETISPGDARRDRPLRRCRRQGLLRRLDPLESPRSGGSRRRRQGGATPDGRPDEAVPRPDSPRRGAAQGAPHRLVQGVAAEIRTDTRRPHRQSAGVRQPEPLQGGQSRHLLLRQLQPYGSLYARHRVQYRPARTAPCGCGIR